MTAPPVPAPAGDRRLSDPVRRRRLRRLLEDYGITSREIAAAASCHEAMVSRVYGGSRTHGPVTARIWRVTFAVLQAKGWTGTVERLQHTPRRGRHARPAV